MPSSAKLSTKTLVTLALLLALAVALRLAENYLLPPLPGGVRLGLANSITILALLLFGARSAGLLLTARIILVGLLSTGLFTPGFLIGLSGAVLSFLLMAAPAARRWFSPLGLGILGACSHNVGQICAAMYLLQAPLLFSYLPLLLLLAIPLGYLTGYLAQLLLPRLKK
ncbi:MAG: Gx transporter family protein [Acidaminococcaceae bacterium]